MANKPWYKSKTVWFNVLAFIVAFVSGFGYTGEIPVSWAIWIPPAITMGNIIIRLLWTNQGLKW